MEHVLEGQERLRNPVSIAWHRGWSARTDMSCIHQQAGGDAVDIRPIVSVDSETDERGPRRRFFQNRRKSRRPRMQADLYDAT